MPRKSTPKSADRSGSGKDSLITEAEADAVIQKMRLTRLSDARARLQKLPASALKHFNSVFP